MYFALFSNPNRTELGNRVQGQRTQGQRTQGQRTQGQRAQRSADNRATRFIWPVLIALTALAVSFAAYGRRHRSSRRRRSARRHNRRKIGDYVRLGKEMFVIWGSAATGCMPKGASITPNGKKMFVSNFGRPNRKIISVYALPALKKVGDLSFRGNSIESAVSPDNKWLYSTNKKGSYLNVVHIPTLKLKKTIKIGGYPKVIEVSPKGRYVYLSRWSDARITRLDTRTWKQKTLRIGKRHPRGLALSPDGSTLYVANNGSRHLTVVDTKTFGVKKHYRVGRGPRHVAVSHDGKRVYVSLMGPDQVVALNAADMSIVKRIKVGRNPKTVEVSRDDHFLYTANYSGHSMNVIDTRTWKTKELKLDIWKGSGLAVHPNDKWIYVTGWCSDDVWAVERVAAGKHPSAPGPMRPRRRICRSCKSIRFMGCRLPKGAWKKKRR
jgi:YVTN family beta-propeller protein